MIITLKASACIGFARKFYVDLSAGLGGEFYTAGVFELGTKFHDLFVDLPILELVLPELELNAGDPVFEGP